MSHAIYKYILPSNPGRHLIELPRGARVLSFGRQDDDLVIWALVDPGNKPEARPFHLHFTGLPFDCATRQDDEYIGTRQMGLLVYHLFEVKNV